MTMLAQAVIIILTCLCLSIIYLSVDNFDYLSRQYSLLKDPYISQQDLIKDIENSVRINVILETLLRDVNNSARTYVFKFHNGTRGVDGLSFIFQSATHMITRPGIVNSIQDLQQLPISINTDKASAYINHRCYSYITNMQEINNAYNNSLLEQGISSTYTCPLYNKENILIGFVGVDFITNAGNVTEIKEEIEKKLLKVGKNLAPYVSNDRKVF